MYLMFVNVCREADFTTPLWVTPNAVKFNLYESIFIIMNRTSSEGNWYPDFVSYSHFRQVEILFFLFSSQIVISSIHYGAPSHFFSSWWIIITWAAVTGADRRLHFCTTLICLIQEKGWLLLKCLSLRTKWFPESSLGV